jgi:hypothetical protein
LFIIGAMKAGTSSLHEYLHQHPEIFMSRFKEPQYFAPHRNRWGQAWGQGNPCPEPGIDWYLRLFADAGTAKYAGESSVSYTAAPWMTGCNESIYTFNPEARLIYIMRDPIERAISHYWFFVGDGCEDLDLLTAIRRREDYVARSNYAMQIKPYLERFGRDRVYLLTLEELTERPRETFRGLFEWLGVDPDVPIASAEKFNVGAERLRQTRRGRIFIDAFLKHWRWRRVARFVPGFVPHLLEGVTYREVSRREADVHGAVQYLRPLFQQYTRDLERLTGRSFPEWRTLYGVSEPPQAEGSPGSWATC